MVCDYPPANRGARCCAGQYCCCTAVLSQVPCWAAEQPVSQPQVALWAGCKWQIS